jgi:hypothetical protein
MEWQQQVRRQCETRYTSGGGATPGENGEGVEIDSAVRFRYIFIHGFYMGFDGPDE